MNVLFEEYEDIKPILQIGSYVLGKYKKKPEQCFPDIVGELNPLVKPKKKRGIVNERQAILKEIQEIIEQENGAKMSKQQMRLFAMKLSHVPTEDLYWMKSQGLDYRNRTKKPFSKFIYGSVKPNK